MNDIITGGKESNPPATDESNLSENLQGSEGSVKVLRKALPNLLLTHLYFIPFCCSVSLCVTGGA
jgi:hypothetical protein